MKAVLITILVILVLYRMLSSFMVQNINKTVKDRMNDQMRNRQTPKPEGEITIEKTKPSKNKNNDDGEYVDYEEVK